MNYAQTDNPKIIDALEEMERRPRVEDDDLTYPLYREVVEGVLHMNPENGDETVRNLRSQMTEDTYQRAIDTCAERWGIATCSNRWGTSPQEAEERAERWGEERLEEAREAYRRYADGTRPSDFEGPSYRWKYTLLSRLGARTLGVTSDEAKAQHDEGWERKSAEEGDRAVLSIFFSDLDMGAPVNGASILSIKGAQWKNLVKENFGLNVASERLIRNSRFFPLLAARYRQQTALESKTHLPTLAQNFVEFAKEKGATAPDGTIDPANFPRSEWDEYAEKNDLPTENHIKRAAGWGNVLALAAEPEYSGPYDPEYASGLIRSVTDPLGVDPCEVSRGKFDQEASKAGKSVRSMSLLLSSPDYTFEGATLVASPLYQEALGKREEWGL